MRGYVSKSVLNRTLLLCGNKALVPSLHLSGVVVGRSWTWELYGLTVQSCVSKQVTEILKQLQELVGCVLEDGQHLCGHHVVHHEEWRLREEEKGDYFLCLLPQGNLYQLYELKF